MLGAAPLNGNLPNQASDNGGGKAAKLEQSRASPKPHLLFAEAPPCEDSDGAPAPPPHFTMDGTPVVQEQRRTSGVTPGGGDSNDNDGGEETDEILDNLESALIRLAGGRGECGRCGKHFSRVADCRRHLLRSHAVGAHFCGICLMQFNNAYALQRHSKRANHFVHR